MTFQDATGQQVASDGLWADRSFRLLFSGYSISAAGTAITRVVLPVLVFEQTGSALKTTTLLALQLVPYITVGPFAGVIADRTNRRTLMIVADIVNAAAVAAIPLLAGAGQLNVAAIYVVALVSATAYTFGNAAELAAVPAIVPRRHLLQAHSAMTAAYEFGFVVATAGAGLLLAMIGPAAAIWVDAATYVMSAVAVALIPASFGTPTAVTDRKPMRTEIAEAVRYIRHHDLIRPLVSVGFANSIAAGSVLGLIVVVAARQLELDTADARIGWLFSAGWAGAFAGAILLPHLSRRLGAPRLTLVMISANGALVALLAAVQTFWTAVIVMAIWQMCWLIAIGNGRVIRQRLTPDRLQARVGITAQILGWGGQPVGAVMGGIVADAASTHVALLVTAGIVTVATLYAWSSALRTTSPDDLEARYAAVEAAQPALGEAAVDSSTN